MAGRGEGGWGEEACLPSPDVADLFSKQYSCCAAPSVNPKITNLADWALLIQVLGGTQSENMVRMILALYSKPK